MEFNTWTENPSNEKTMNGIKHMDSNGFGIILVWQPPCGEIVKCKKERTSKGRGGRECGDQFGSSIYWLWGT